MAYVPIQSPKWSERDALPQGDQRKIIKAADFDTEFNNIKTAFDEIAGGSHASELASVKYSGGQVKYGYNVSSVEKEASGVWRVNFTNPINSDGVETAGDFAGVVTPYAIGGKMFIANIADQREAWVNIAFRMLDGGSWVVPDDVAFAFILIDQDAS